MTNLEREIYENVFIDGYRLGVEHATELEEDMEEEIEKELRKLEERVWFAELCLRKGMDHEKIASATGLTPESVRELQDVFSETD